MLLSSLEKLKWYGNRLSTMSVEEVIKMRLYRAIRNRIVPLDPKLPQDLQLDLNISEFSQWDGFADRFPEANKRILKEADAALENKFTLFGQQFDFGPSVAWNNDILTQQKWPVVPVQELDYRDGAGGDPKDVWELNRHAFLLPLAQAWRLTGDQRYPEKIISLIESWLDACPAYHGINWTSCIEYSTRQLSWLWAIKLISDSDAISSEFLQRVAQAMYRQTHFIARNLSLYSSANNHLISELCTLVVIGQALGQDDWIQTGRDYLSEYLNSQILEDGTGAEQAPNYLAHTMEFYALALLNLKEPISPKAKSRLAAGANYIRSMLGDSGWSGAFGDNDSGHILPLEATYCEHKSLLNLIGHLLDKPGISATDCDRDDKLFWLLGHRKTDVHCAKVKRSKPATSVNAFPKGGYYILEQQWPNGHVRVIFDAGHLGLAPLAAHGHMDALSFVLEINGQPLLVDPGTYTYFKALEWRDYFRSTRGHNTITIDSQDQSIPGGRFLYKYQAKSECLEFRDGESVTGRHDGFTRLADPVIHTRRIVLKSALQEIEIQDTLTGKSPHSLNQFFHFHPDCRVERSGPNRYEGHPSTGPKVEFLMDSQASWNLVCGRENDILGWYSREYNQKVPSPCLEGEMQFSAVAQLSTRIRLGEN